MSLRDAARDFFALEEVRDNNLAPVQPCCSLRQLVALVHSQGMEGQQQDWWTMIPGPGLLEAIAVDSHGARSSVCGFLAVP